MRYSYEIPQLHLFSVQLLYSLNSVVFPHLIYFDNYPQTGAWVLASMDLIFQWQLKRLQVVEYVPERDNQVTKNRLSNKAPEMSLEISVPCHHKICMPTFSGRN